MPMAANEAAITGLHMVRIRWAVEDWFTGTFVMLLLMIMTIQPPWRTMGSERRKVRLLASASMRGPVNGGSCSTK